MFCKKIRESGDHPIHPFTHSRINYTYIISWQMPTYFGRLPRQSIPVPYYTCHYKVFCWCLCQISCAASWVYWYSLFLSTPCPHLLSPFLTRYLKLNIVFQRNLCNWNKIKMWFSCRFCSCSYSAICCLLFLFFWQESDIIYSCDT